MGRSEPGLNRLQANVQKIGPVFLNIQGRCEFAAK